MSNVSPRPPQPPRRPGTNHLGTALIVGIVVAAVIVGFVLIGTFVGNGPSSNASQTKPTNPTLASPTVPGHTIPPSTSPTSPNLPPLHCLPAPPAPKKPQQFSKPPSASLAQDATWRATLLTNCGTVVIDLDGKLAPQTVSSFIFLSQKHFYDNTPCHRLTTAEQGLSVLQCGDPTGTGSGGPGYGYGMENAPKNGKYPAGTVAMARTQDPNSNGSQFFIVYADTSLPDPTGYSIFGKVVQGLDIVKAIAARGLAANGESPAQPISILSVKLAKL